MKINIPHIAKLANIPIKKSDEEKYEKQLEETLAHIERLQEIDTTHVSGTNEVTNLSNVVREDIAAPSLTQQQALQNGKATYHGFFKVKAIL